MTSSPPRQGGIYLVEDKALSLPPNNERNLHKERRPVVVLSGRRTNEDTSWPLVLVVPLSTATSYKTEFCVKIAMGEGGSSKKTWARVPAVQPILKTALTDHSGVLATARLEEIQSSLLRYMELID